MPFTLPNFNLRCNIFSFGFPPPSLPRVADVPCQLYTNSRVPFVHQSDWADVPEICTQLRLPWGTDIRETDWVQIVGAPPAMEWWFADDPLPVHMGFVNQYYFAGLTNNGGVPTPPPPSYILEETGFHILLETGPPDAILLE